LSELTVVLISSIVFVVGLIVTAQWILWATFNIGDAFADASGKIILIVVVFMMIGSASSGVNRFIRHG